MYKKIYKSLFLIALVSFSSGCDDKKELQTRPKTNIINDKNDTNISKLIIPKIKIDENITKKVIKKNIVYRPSKDIVDKKANFRNILVPIITSTYNQLQTQYQDIKRDLNSSKNSEFIANLKIRYKVKTDQELLRAIKPHPISIALSQAAAESAWLTSRFTKNANNIFGVWSFDKNEPRIPASGLRGDKIIYLKKYKTLKLAVEDYYFSIGKSWAYDEFRKLRVKTDDPYLLIPHLKNYSEKKEEYTKMLGKILKYNKFDKFDVK